MHSLYLEESCVERNCHFSGPLYSLESPVWRKEERIFYWTINYCYNTWYNHLGRGVCKIKGFVGWGGGLRSILTFRGLVWKLEWLGRKAWFNFGVIQEARKKDVVNENCYKLHIYLWHVNCFVKVNNKFPFWVNLERTILNKKWCNKHIYNLCFANAVQIMYSICQSKAVPYTN